MSPPKEDIMVVWIWLLSNIKKEKRGFIPVFAAQTEKFLLENSDFMAVIHAEKNSLYREIIPYVVIYNNHSRRILVYEEIEVKNSKDFPIRLILWLKLYVKKFSWNPVNVIKETIVNALTEYLSINFAHIASIDLQWYVFDDENIEEKSKLGLFYFVRILWETNLVENPYFRLIEYMTIDELEAYTASREVEIWRWSSLIFPALERKVREIEAHDKEKAEM